MRVSEDPSQNVTNKSCEVYVKGEIYAFWDTQTPWIHEVQYRGISSEGPRLYATTYVTCITARKKVPVILTLVYRYELLVL